MLSAACPQARPGCGRAARGAWWSAHRTRPHEHRAPQPRAARSHPRCPTRRHHAVRPTDGRVCIQGNPQGMRDRTLYSTQRIRRRVRRRRVSGCAVRRVRVAPGLRNAAAFEHDPLLEAHERPRQGRSALRRGPLPRLMVYTLHRFLARADGARGLSDYRYRAAPLFISSFICAGGLTTRCTRRRAAVGPHRTPATPTAGSGNVCARAPDRPSHPRRVHRSHDRCR